VVPAETVRQQIVLVPVCFYAEVWQTSGQPLLTLTIQARRLSLFEHTARLDDNAYAKNIVIAFPPQD